MLNIKKIKNLLLFNILEKTSLLIFLFMFLICNHFHAQRSILFNNSTTEYTSDQQLMKMYVDSLGEYAYRDIEFAEKIVEESESLIEASSTLSDSIKFEYLLQRIYLEYGKFDPVEAFKLISEFQNDIPPSISENQLASFIYLKNFTFMSLGDLEAAQKSFYKEITLGREKKDTSRIFNNLYSLGGLLNDEGEYNSALKYLREAETYLDPIKDRPSTQILLLIEISTSYMALNEIEIAKQIQAKAQTIIDDNSVHLLESDLLVLKGELALQDGNFIEAYEVHGKLVGLRQGEDDYNNIIFSDNLLSDILIAEKKYPKAFQVILKFIAEIDSTNEDKLLQAYTKAHKICEAMNNYDCAYDYLSKYINLKTRLDEDTKRQKTGYLNIKYASEEKEKKNLQLQLQLEKSRSRQRIAILIFGLAILGFLILSYTLVQRRRYSRQLESQVQKRTKKLKESNKLLTQSYEEIDEFNRIIAHDLTEPLRSIVGFSQLAKRDIHDHDKATEHLGIVKKSGKQLEQLINDIGVYRELSSIRTMVYQNIKLDDLLKNINKIAQEKYPNKNIEINYDNNQIINCPAPIIEKVFSSIIDNSIRYNENKNVNIDIDYKLDQSQHQFELRDNGIGIPNEYHKQVFKMFNRLHNRKTFEGTGLGLSLAQRLIEKIGGSIFIKESTIGKSTTVAFNFSENP